jgi:hypothetical protein
VEVWDTDRGDAIVTATLQAKDMMLAIPLAELQSKIALKVIPRTPEASADANITSRPSQCVLHVAPIPSRGRLAWAQSTYQISADSGGYLVNNMEEHGIRPPASVAISIAIALTTGVYGEQLAGVRDQTGLGIQ